MRKFRSLIKQIRSHQMGKSRKKSDSLKNLPSLTKANSLALQEQVKRENPIIDILSTESDSGQKYLKKKSAACVTSGNQMN